EYASNPKISDTETSFFKTFALGYHKQQLQLSAVLNRFGISHYFPPVSMFNILNLQINNIQALFENLQNSGIIMR
ncbi:MAG: hypothetical protein AABZ36_00495, partial [Nitrospirota bacterium]